MSRNENLGLNQAEREAHARGPVTMSISMVKNEQDVIEAFVRHNIRLIDTMVIVDNGSVDNTVRILLQLAEEFDNLVLAEEGGFAYNQSERMTRWLNEYQTRFNSDYVFPLDADEFLDVEGEATFHDVIREIPEGGYGHIPWCTYVLTPDVDLSGVLDPLRAMNFRRRQELPPRFKAIIRLDGKSAEDLVITAGNHGVLSKSGRTIAGKRLDGLRLLHYPLRSLDQAKSKSVVGWMACLAIDTRIGESRNAHQWRVSFDEFSSDQGVDYKRLCEMSMLYSQQVRPIDWSRDVVLDPSRLLYERRYSTGKEFEAAELIARSWEMSVTHTRRHGPSIELSTLTGNRQAGDASGASSATREEGGIQQVLAELVEEGKTAEAIKLLESLLVQGGTAELWNDWATLQCGASDLAKAQLGYRHALRLDSSHRQAAVNLAILLVSGAEFQQAIEVLRGHSIMLTASEKDAIRAIATPLVAGSEEPFPIEELIHPPKRKRKYLVVVRAGDTSLHPTWLEDPAERNWDLIVHAYGEECPWGNEDGVEVIRATGADIVGPKMRAMHSLYQKRKTDLLAYDYVCFADDDLATTQENFNRLFRMCQHYGLELAQPALTHDSFMGAWGITMENRSFLVRYTNFVEVMCPVFSRAFLERCAPTFIENVSGYGLDLLWSNWVSSPWKIGIIDCCPVRHSRMSFSGQIYKTLAQMGVNPDQELIDLIRKWKLVRPEEQVTGQVVVPVAVNNGGILLDQSRIATSAGQGIELMRALLNGFPKELAADHHKVLHLLSPTMQQTAIRYVQGDPDPDRLAVEKQTVGSA